MHVSSTLYRHLPHNLIVSSNVVILHFMEESILSEAQRLTGGERQEAYGHALDDYTRTAALWTALLGPKLAPGATITWDDAIRCMCAVKLSRDVHSMSRDNMVDLAGYAKCRQEALEKMERELVPAAPCRDCLQQVYGDLLNG